MCNAIRVPDQGWWEQGSYHRLAPRLEPGEEKIQKKKRTGRLT